MTSDDWPAGDPWRSLVLHDLRFCARSLAEASRESRRPRPRPVRRVVDIYSFPRHNRDAPLAEASTGEERRARQRLRSRVGTILRFANSPSAQLDFDAVDSVDIPPARHRHSTIWLA